MYWYTDLCLYEAWTTGEGGGGLAALERWLPYTVTTIDRSTVVLPGCLDRWLYYRGM